MLSTTPGGGITQLNWEGKGKLGRWVCNRCGMKWLRMMAEKPLESAGALRREAKVKEQQVLL